METVLPDVTQECRAMCSPLNTADPVMVGMGQATVGIEQTRLIAILGSCVALSLYSPAKRAGILGHVVLPYNTHRTAMPTKYANVALPYMLNTLQQCDIPPAGLIAKLAGGACMFDDDTLRPIGEANVTAVVESLTALGITIAGAHTGGKCGRRVVFCCSTGELRIETVGNPPVIL